MDQATRLAFEGLAERTDRMADLLEETQRRIDALEGALFRGEPITRPRQGKIHARCLTCGGVAQGEGPVAIEHRGLCQDDPTTELFRRIPPCGW